MAAQCPWCTEGYQTHEQLHAWGVFRNRMKHISGTYGFLDAIVNDVLDRLERYGGSEAMALWEEGHEILGGWDACDPLYGGRDKYTQALIQFNKRALDFLTGAEKRRRRR